VAEARDNGGSGSGDGATTDQRRANMKKQFQWNSNLKCQCQRKLVRKTKNINEKHVNAKEGIRETYNGKKERRCREELNSNASARTVKTKARVEKKVKV